ncbi:MAG: hypothetical protein ABSA52_15250 [Candidatus Binatia bacterium]|jgi:hypothetical protein
MIKRVAAFTLAASLLGLQPAFGGLICTLDNGGEATLVFRPGKMSETMKLHDEGMNEESVRCCVACLPKNGVKVIITDQGFASHTIRVLEGPDKGCVGDVPAEHVKGCH